MLADHGKMARGYPDVRANTVASFAGRLRVDPRLRGRRAVPHRRPHAPPARLRGPHARPRGGPVLTPGAARTSRSWWLARLTGGRCRRVGGPVVPWEMAPGAARTSRSWWPGSPIRRRRRADPARARPPASVRVPGAGARRVPRREAAVQQVRLQVAVDAGVRAAGDAVRPRVPLGHQHRARQPPAQLQRAVVAEWPRPARRPAPASAQLTRPGAHVEGAAGAPASRRTAGSSTRCPITPRTAPGAPAAYCPGPRPSKSVGQDASLHSTAVYTALEFSAPTAPSSVRVPRLVDQRLRIALFR